MGFNTDLAVTNHMATIGVGADVGDAIFWYESVICGHHVYKRIWTPTTAEILSLNTDPTNRHDRFAIAVLKAGAIVGHVPRKLNRNFHFFFISGGKIMCEVTGKRKFGKGLELPCVYKFTGTEKNMTKVKKILSKKL